MNEVQNEKTVWPRLVYRPQGETVFEDLKQGKKYARSKLLVSIDLFLHFIIQDLLLFYVFEMNFLMF